MAATTLLDLLESARAIVGDGGSSVHLVLWRLSRTRPEDAAARWEMDEILRLDEDRPSSIERHRRPSAEPGGHP